MKECENRDGHPVRFEGLGHVFCRECYDQWIKVQRAAGQNPLGEQMTLGADWKRPKME